MADIRVRMPDGTTITFPDGTPPETMERIAREHYASRRTPAPVPDTSIGHEARATTAAFNRGVANLVGAPVDLVTGGINIAARGANWLGRQVGADPGLGQIEDPVGGSQSLRRGMESIGIDTSTEPNTGAGRVAATAAEYVGGAVPVMAGANIARAATTLGPRGQALVDALASQPGLQTLASAGAGIGAGTLSEADPRFGQQAGAVLGALAGGAAAGRLARGASIRGQIGSTAIGGTAGYYAGRALGGTEEGQELTGAALGGATVLLPWIGIPAILRLGGAVAEPLSERGRRQIVGRAMQAFAASRDPAALADDIVRAAADPPVPGAVPTTAQAAMDPGLAGLQRGLQNVSPTNFAPLLAERHVAQSAARTALIDATLPPGTAEQAVADAVRRRVMEFRSDTGPIVERTRAAAEAAATRLGTEITPEAAGRTARSEMTAAYGVGENPPETTVRGRVNSLFRAIDPNSTTTIQITPLVDATRTAQARYFGPGAGNPPADISSLIADIERLAAASTTQPYQTLQNIRSQALDLANQYGVSGNNRARSMASAVAREVDETITNAARTGAGMTPEQRAAWEAARAARTDQGAVYEQGAADRVLSVGRDRGLVVPDSDVMARFFHSGGGGPEDATQFAAAVGASPGAMDALRSYAATSLRAAALDPVTGEFRREAWRRWMDRHAGALRVFPEMYREFSNAGRAQGVAESVASQQARAIESFELTAAGTFLRQNPEDAVRSVMASRMIGRDLTALVRQVHGDPMALAGLRRAVMNELIRQSDTTAVDATGRTVTSPARWIDALRTIEPDLARSGLYTQAQTDVIERLTREIQSQRFVATAGTPPGTNTMQNMSVANLLATITGGAVSNQMISASMAAGAGRAVMTRFLNWVYRTPSDEIGRLLIEGMIDPRLGAQLIRSATPRTISDLLRTLRIRGFVTESLAVPQATAPDRPAADAPR